MKDRWRLEWWVDTNAFRRAKNTHQWRPVTTGRYSEPRKELTFNTLDDAFIATKSVKTQTPYASAVLRIHNLRTGDVIMVDIL